MILEITQDTLCIDQNINLTCFYQIYIDLSFEKVQDIVFWQTKSLILR